MAKYLDSTGLKKYDELIKTYIGNNGGKIDDIKVKVPGATTAESLTINDKSVTLDLSTYTTGILFAGGVTKTPQAGLITITKDEVISAIGTATTSLAGLMSKEDKANLDTLVDLLGNSTDGEDSDADTVVDTIREVLKIFEQYGEGTTIVSALAGKANVDDVYSKTVADSTFVKNDDLEGKFADYVPTTRKVNGRALSGDLTWNYGTSWSGGKVYYYGDIVYNSALVYLCIKEHSSSASITTGNSTYWRKIGAIQNATTSADGLMSLTDKIRLDNLYATNPTADSALTETDVQKIYDGTYTE